MPNLPSPLARVTSKIPATTQEALPGPDDLECWKPIPGWPYYDVSDWGRVQSYRGGPAGKSGGQGRRGIRLTPVIIRGQIVTDGRRRITLSRNLPDGSSEKQIFAAHVLVLMAFVGPCPEGMEACHGPDRNPLNNRLSNLRWDTRRENAIDRLNHDRHWCRKLAGSDIPEIWRRLVRGDRSTDVARDFGVTTQTISAIKGGKTWTHITCKLPGWPLMLSDRDEQEPVYIPDEFILTPEEIWRVLPRHPAFRVSNFGGLQSRWQSAQGPDGRFLSPILGDTWHDRILSRGRKGHLMFSVPKPPGTGTTLRLHVCILEVFSGLRPPGMHACHGDGNPANNLASNLRWDTQSANAKDRVKHAQERSDPHIPLSE